MDKEKKRKEQKLATYFSGIISLHVTVLKMDPFMPFRVAEQAEGQGTAFCISEDGICLTAAHVIENAVNITGRFLLTTQREYPVEVKAVYPAFDLAILQIKSINGYKLPKYTPLKLGDSDIIEAGQTIFAIGFPLSAESPQVSEGTISGVRMSRISTDANLNPGNSGGPSMIYNNKLNEWQVIGVNSAVLLSVQTPSAGSGLIIPINVFHRIKNRLLDPKSSIVVPLPVIGIKTQPKTHGLKNLENYKDCEGGVLVTNIHTDKTEFKKLDLICSVNGDPIDEYGDVLIGEKRESLVQYLAKQSPNETLTFELFRPNSKGKIVIKQKLFEENQIYPIRSLFMPFEKPSYVIFGGMVLSDLNLNILLLQEMIQQAEVFFKDLRNKPRLVVTTVFPGSEIGNKSVTMVGDQIKFVNDKEVNSVKEFKKVVYEIINNQNGKVKIEFASGGVYFGDKDTIIKNEMKLVKNGIAPPGFLTRKAALPLMKGPDMFDKPVELNSEILNEIIGNIDKTN